MKIDKKDQDMHILKILMTYLILIVFVRSYVLTVFAVDGESMLPTLNNGEYIIVNTWEYQVEPVNRFDIIVFRRLDGTYFVKRVIGLPGEEIAIINEKLHVNELVIEEPHIHEEYPHMISDFLLSYLSPQDKISSNSYFVLGDYRSQSLDSRHFGFINESQIVGKVEIVYFPRIRRIY